MTKDVKVLPERDLTWMFISSEMATKKKVKAHPTDGLKGLKIYFDGTFENPLLSKMTPYIFAFGGRIFNRLDERVECLVQGQKPSIPKRDLAKFPNLKIMDYQTFMDTFFKSQSYY